VSLIASDDVDIGIYNECDHCRLKRLEREKWIRENTSFFGQVAQGNTSEAFLAGIIVLVIIVILALVVKR
jgi:hypothetical protein